MPARCSPLSMVVAVLLLGVSLRLGWAEEAAPDKTTYGVLYEVRIAAGEPTARVAIRITQAAALVRSLRFSIDPGRHQNFKGDGELKAEGDKVLWVPPPTGGELRYTFAMNHLRDKEKHSYDARVEDRWALIRGDDLIPPAHASTEDGAHAQATLKWLMPDQWSATTPYAKGKDGEFVIDNPQRRFDRPTGWMLLGHMRVLRDRVGAVKVAVAAPAGHGRRQHDILALLRWTIPALETLAGTIHERLLVVTAGDPMWRGGLSGPRSLFVHADRPLLSSDGTSPLLHELMHTVMQARAGERGDWIVEGLAELYSLELLERSGTISRQRYHKVLDKIAKRGSSVKALEVDHASNVVTARAAAVLHKLDLRMRKLSENRANLDSVLRVMIAAPDAWTTAKFRALCERFAGASLDEFFQKYVVAK